MSFSVDISELTLTGPQTPLAALEVDGALIDFTAYIDSLSDVTEGTPYTATLTGFANEAEAFSASRKITFESVVTSPQIDLWAETSETLLSFGNLSATAEVDNLVVSGESLLSFSKVHAPTAVDLLQVSAETALVFTNITTPAPSLANWSMSVETRLGFVEQYVSAQIDNLEVITQTLQLTFSEVAATPKVDDFYLEPNVDLLFQTQSVSPKMDPLIVGSHTLLGFNALNVATHIDPLSIVLGVQLSFAKINAPAAMDTFFLNNSLLGTIDVNSIVVTVLGEEIITVTATATNDVSVSKLDQMNLLVTKPSALN